MIIDKWWKNLSVFFFQVLILLFIFSQKQYYIIKITYYEIYTWLVLLGQVEDYFFF